MAWLSGWAKRRQITIDHNDIDEDLTDFPVLLHLSASSGINGADVTSIFDEVGANRKKIAVTLADGVTQCYVEVEKWDAVNKKAWLWVKVPSISATEDTVLYIYYDNNQPDNTAYVGDTGETPAQNVWDEHFVFVSHMRDDPDSSHIKDSTSNANNGTKKGAGEPAVTTNGKIDDAQDFDGTDDMITVTDDPTLNFDASDPMTLEAWINVTDKNLSGTANYQYIFSKRLNGTGTGYELYLQADGYLRFLIRCSNENLCYITDNLCLYGGWHYVVGVRDVAEDKLRLFVDGAEAITPITDTTTGTLTNAADLRIGRTDFTEHRYLNGIADELRISKARRSDAWIKATYETVRDNLLTWGSEETAGVAHEVTVAESLGLADSIVKRADYGTLVSGAEKLGMAESITKRVDYRTLLSGTEKLGIIDEAAVQPVILLVVAEKLGLIDEFTRRVDYKTLVGGAERLGLAESITKRVDYRTILSGTEKLGIIDEAAVQTVILLLAAEKLGLVSRVKPTASYHLYIEEKLGLKERVPIGKPIYIEVTEKLGLVDREKILLTLYTPAVTVPANTPKDAPVTYMLYVEEDYITSIDIYFPPGCCGLCRVQAYYGSEQLAPKPTGADFRGDNMLVRFPMRWKVPEKPCPIRFVLWNLDDTYSHTPIILVSTAEEEQVKPYKPVSEFVNLFKRLLGIRG